MHHPLVSLEQIMVSLARPIFEGKDSLDQVRKIIGVLGCQAHEDEGGLVQEQGKLD